MGTHELKADLPGFQAWLDGASPGTGGGLGGTGEAPGVVSGQLEGIDGWPAALARPGCPPRRGKLGSGSGGWPGEPRRVPGRFEIFLLRTRTWYLMRGCRPTVAGTVNLGKSAD